MKKMAALFLLILLITAGCSRGEKCTADNFIGEFNDYGGDYRIDEEKIEVYGDENSREYRAFLGDEVLLTLVMSGERVAACRVSFAQGGKSELFLDACRRSCRVFAQLDEKETETVLAELGLNSEKKADGLCRHDTVHHRFRFAEESFGGTLIIENSALCPTSRADVTTRVSAEK